MTTQQCPICGVRVEPSTRYPRYVCTECASKAGSVDGRALEFGNADLSGGFVARFADTGEDYLSHECMIEGVRCYADEARFGGIVIQAEQKGAGRESHVAAGPPVLAVQPTMDLTQAAQKYTAFLNGNSLRQWVSDHERVSDRDFTSIDSESVAALHAAFAIKRTVSELNTFIHAVGILTCLPHLLEPGEKVTSLSLGAGNSKKDFDLETDRRVAEFKFIAWKGADSVRQDSVFADIVKLALDPSSRRKILYLTGADLAVKFLRGGRAIDSVLKRRSVLKSAFIQKYGDQFTSVSDFIQCQLNTVQVIDLNTVVPGLASLITGIP